MSRTRAHRIRLSEADRQMLTGLVRTGSHPAQEVRRARILLELDENDPGHGGPVATQSEIAARAGVSTETIRRVGLAYTCHDGDVIATINRKQRGRPPVEPKVTGDVEARLIQLACSQPPDGYSRWSLRLLERHVSLADDIPDLDHSTIGRVLKKRHFALI